MRATDVGRLDLAELEDERVGDVALLHRGLAHVELPRLAVVVGEALGPSRRFWPRRRAAEGRETRVRVLARPAGARPTTSWARS